jgi:dTDP-glucose 4,6-dehydratase
MNETLFVTGGAGFIGSNLVEHILETTDYSVVVLDALTYAGSLRNIRQFWKHPRFVFSECNIGDQFRLEALFHDFEPVGILHLAAESHVDNSINDPSNFIQSNIVGTYRLLQATKRYIQETGIKKFRFLHVSTDEVYGSLPDSGRFNEECKYHPNSPYSASKAASDHLVTAYHETFGLDTIITNCSNNYGPKQHQEKLIPKTIINALESKPIPIYGRGNNIRDWIHVKDHCAGLMAAFKFGTSGETYCIGGDNERTNIDIVRRICELVDLKLNSSWCRLKLVEHVEDRLGHDMRYAIDSTKIRKTCNWNPVIPFQEGLAETVDWYIQNGRASIRR